MADALRQSVAQVDHPALTAYYQQQLKQGHSLHLAQQ